MTGTHLSRRQTPRSPKASKKRAHGAESRTASPETLRLRAEVRRLLVEPAPKKFITDNFDAQPVGYILLDEHGLVHATNRRLEEMLGCPTNYIRNANFSRFVTHQHLPRFLEHLRRAKQQETAITRDLPLNTADGRGLYVELISSRFITDTGVWFRTCLVDRTELRREAELAAQTQYRYQALLNTVEGIVWEAEGPSFDITFVSNFAEKLLGYPLTSWFTPGYWENHVHVDDRDRVMHAVSRALAKNSNFTVDYRVFSAERRVLWLHDAVNVQRHGGKLKLLGIAMDITEQKESERRLQTTQGFLESSVAQRTAELRETVTDLEAFSYSMSHDLRAPLRAIQGYSELLQQSLSKHLDRSQQEFFERIKSSTTRMDSLIQDVLTYSRLARAPLELQPVNVEKVVEDVIRDYPALQRPNAEIEIEKPLRTVKGHPAFLSQCVSNLLWNAVKFVPQGQKPRVRVRTVAAHSDVEIWFEDNGIGIAPEDHKRIFGIFQRLHSDKSYQGTGIGLAIVQKAVERMGGRVGVESALGHGSKFWLRLHSVQ